LAIISVDGGIERNVIMAKHCLSHAEHHAVNRQTFAKTHSQSASGEFARRFMTSSKKGTGVIAESFSSLD